MSQLPVVAILMLHRQMFYLKIKKKGVMFLPLISEIQFSLQHGSTWKICLTNFKHEVKGYLCFIIRFYLEK